MRLKPQGGTANRGLLEHRVSVPVLLHLEVPLELQMRMLIIVGEQ